MKTVTIRTVLIFGVLLFGVWSFSGCSDIQKKDTVYIYGIGLQPHPMGVCLSVLTNRYPDASGEQANQEKKSEDSEHVTPPTDFSVLVYTGKTVLKAFEKFYTDNQAVYSGTNRAYLVSFDLPPAETVALGTYVLNSPRLPLKRELALCRNPHAFFEQCEQVCTVSDYNRLFVQNGHGKNVALAVAELAQRHRFSGVRQVKSPLNGRKQEEKTGE